MNFWQFLQKGLSEDNGNPSARRINVFLACTLFTIGIITAEVVVIFWIPSLIMEMTIALLSWMTVALGLGIYAKTKEQNITPSELQGLRQQESDIKKSEEAKPQG